MKRSTAITWDQLKVGGLILTALVIVALTIFKLGQAASLFTRRYSLVSFLPNASGLLVGGQVTVAGQLAGSIKSIEFLPVDQDTTRNLKIVISLNRDVASQVRKDSKAKVKTLGLLGDKVFDISTGTPRFARLKEGDTITAEPSVDYEVVVAQASAAIADVVLLTRDLKKVTAGINNGQGTLGQLVTNRALYDQATVALTRTSALMSRLENPNGTVGHLLNDPQLYYSLNRTLASVDTLVAGINSSNGTVSKLLKDDSLYVRLVSVVANADTMVKRLSAGNGTVSKMFTDAQLYDQLVKTVTELNAVLVDVRKDPRRYTKGMIGVKLF
jgi:phospholipid/cholesterol/gamma-HCH transport system substrate-binding protein